MNLGFFLRYFVNRAPGPSVFGKNDANVRPISMPQLIIAEADWICSSTRTWFGFQKAYDASNFGVLWIGLGDGFTFVFCSSPLLLWRHASPTISSSAEPRMPTSTALRASKEYPTSGHIIPWNDLVRCLSKVRLWWAKKGWAKIA